jgi:YVTN family beta-propeller protein
VQAGTNPDAIIYDAASKRVFAMNGRSNNVTAIDAATGNVAGTTAVDGKPEFAVADGDGRVYVNIEDKSEMQAIDSQKLAVTATWKLAPCQEPSGLAIDTAHRRLFAGCDNKMMAVVDADSGKVIATPAIGEGVDADGFDPGTGFAFASNGQSGTLTVVHEDAPDKFSVVEDVPTQRGARTMALDPKTHEVFLVTADFGPRPAATPDNPRPRPPMVPDSFVVLVFGR